MSLENEVQRSIEDALLDLRIVAKFDVDNDLEITLKYREDCISSTYVDLSEVFLKRFTADD